ncbi:unnamed protein product, partial [Rangifer tarandus platyrhynchus]
MTPRPEEQAVTRCDVLSKSRSDPTTRVPSAGSATAGASGPTHPAAAVAAWCSDQ